MTACLVQYNLYINAGKSKNPMFSFSRLESCKCCANMWIVNYNTKIQPNAFYANVNVWDNNFYLRLGYLIIKFHCSRKFKLPEWESSIEQGNFFYYVNETCSLKTMEPNITSHRNWKLFVCIFYNSLTIPKWICINCTCLIKHR